jgi:peroxiredoxin
MEEKPFVIIGINTNGYKPDKLKSVMDKEKLNWRSFADHGGDAGFGGPISTKWNLQGTPTLFVLDHKGVIRYRWLGNPSEKKIDEALAKLIKEAEEDGKRPPK